MVYYLGMVEPSKTATVFPLPMVMRGGFTLSTLINGIREEYRWQHSPETPHPDIRILSRMLSEVYAQEQEVAAAKHNKTVETLFPVHRAWRYDLDQKNRLVKPSRSFVNDVSAIIIRDLCDPYEGTLTKQGIKNLNRLWSRATKYYISTGALPKADAWNELTVEELIEGKPAFKKRTYVQVAYENLLAYPQRREPLRSMVKHDELIALKPLDPKHLIVRLDTSTPDFIEGLYLKGRSIGGPEKHDLLLTLPNVMASYKFWHDSAARVEFDVGGIHVIIYHCGGLSPEQFDETAEAVFSGRLMPKTITLFVSGDDGLMVIGTGCGTPYPDASILRTDFSQFDQTQGAHTCVVAPKIWYPHVGISPMVQERLLRTYTYGCQVKRVGKEHSFTFLSVGSQYPTKFNTGSASTYFHNTVTHDIHDVWLIKRWAMGERVDYQTHCSQMGLKAKVFVLSSHVCAEFLRSYPVVSTTEDFMWALSPALILKFGQFKTPIEELIHAHAPTEDAVMRQLLGGLYHCLNMFPKDVPVMGAFREFCRRHMQEPSALVMRHLELDFVYKTTSRLLVSRESYQLLLFEQYGISVDESDEFDKLLSGLEMYDTIAHPVLDKIALDYLA